jgi:hypothetical protein
MGRANCLQHTQHTLRSARLLWSRGDIRRIKNNSFRGGEAENNYSFRGGRREARLQKKPEKKEGYFIY